MNGFGPGQSRDRLCQTTRPRQPPYFPLEHPALVWINLINPLYHLAEVCRGILIGGPVGGHLGGVAALSAVLLGALVPLDIRLLRKRVLGD